MPTKLPHITDDHHFAIANVATRSSQLEIHIEKTIEVGLNNQPKIAEYLLKSLNTDRVTGLLKAMLLDAAPEEEQQIDNLIKTIAGIRTERNEILHWSWIPGLKPGESISATSRPFRKFRYVERSAEQVQKIADEAQTVIRALLQWQTFLREGPAAPLP